MKNVEDSTKAHCVLWCHESKSPTVVNRKFRYKFGKDPFYIKRWFRPSIDEGTVDAVRVAFYRGQRKSIRVASNELAIS